MSLDIQQQFKNFLEKSKEILVLLPQNPQGDEIGSAWALYFFLKKRGFSPTIGLSGELPSKFSFLPKPERIAAEISGARDFVLSFDTTRNKIIRIKTEEKANRYNVYVTPEKGSVDPRDFSFILAKFNYDLLIVLGCSDLEKLGKIYETNSDLFFEVPIINIDHQSSNENFGQINLVDVTASSTSEIVSLALEQNYPEALDEEVANCLLTGIISATNSFQENSTTPKTFLAAANLMDKGARQQEIIRWLYKTQSFSTLKLWGRVMAKLKLEESVKLVWSELTIEDFVYSRTRPEDLQIILEKLKENYSEGKTFLCLFNDTPESTVALIKSVSSELLKKLATVFSGEIKQESLKIKFNSGNLAETGKTVVAKIKELSLS
jgi:nanoRNase/pAp phosphatase (c-di-AMP/oligoRNAs hydrolase)